MSKNYHFSCFQKCIGIFKFDVSKVPIRFTSLLEKILMLKNGAFFSITNVNKRQKKTPIIVNTIIHQFATLSICKIHE